MTDKTAPTKNEPSAASSDSARAARQDRRARRTRVALAVILALLVLLLMTLTAFVLKLMTPVGSPESGDLTKGLKWVRSIYGWGKAENQQLAAPSDVAIGPDGTIWANDPQRWQIIGFNPDGSYKALIHKGPGYMMPQALTVSDDNLLYVADFKESRIRVITPGNKELRSWPSTLPMEVAVKDNLVAVGQRDGVTLYDTQGKLITSWGTRGHRENEVDVVRGIAIGPDGSIYVSDTQNHRLKSYTQQGKLNWIYPSDADFKNWAGQAKKGGKPKKPFQIPTGMTFDSAGRLILVDPFEFTIIAVDPKTGKVTKTYGEYGETDGKFAYPTSISFDPARDWFAVADTANNRVQILRITGSGGSPLSGVARASAWPLWVCSIPLILLLIAIGILVARRRAERKEEVGAEDAIAGADASVSPDTEHSE